MCVFIAGVVALSRGGLQWAGQGAASSSAELGTSVLVVRVLHDVPLTVKEDGGVSTLQRVASRHPVDGAKVVIWRQLPDRTFREVGVAVTDSHGTVTLEDLPSGAAWVLIEADGLARVSRPVMLSPESKLSVELGPAHRLNIQVRDEQGEPIAGATVLVNDSDVLPFGALSGESEPARFARLGPAPWRVRVFARGYESLTLGSIKSDQTVVLTPLSNLQVTVLNAALEPASTATVLIVGASLWPARKILTDSAGKALISGLRPGRYELKAISGTQVSPAVSSIQLERSETRELELVLGRGRMVPILVEHDSLGYNEPVAGAHIVLADYGVSAFPLTGKTDSKGRITLGPIASGAGVVSVSAAPLIGPGALPVPEKLDGPLKVMLHRGATLIGTVTDSAGRPISDARVEVVGVDTLGLPVAETPLRAAYRAAHFESSLRPAQWIAAGELGITQGPVPYVNQALSGGAWNTLPDSYSPWVTNFEGHFRARPVPAGRLRALVRHNKYVEALSAPVTVGFGGEAHVVVTLTEGAKISGVIVNDAGRPVAGARIKVSATDGAFEQSVICAADGRFDFDAVPPNVVVMLARPESITHFVLRQKVSLRSGEHRELSLVLPPERGAVRLRVLDHSERPIELAQVSVASVEPGIPFRETRFSDARGWVEFDDALGLAVTVRITAAGYVATRSQVQGLQFERDFSLYKGVTLRGRIMAVRGRQTVPGARVLLTAPEMSVARTTDALGYYEFEHVPPGLVSLKITHKQYATRRKDVTLAETGHSGRAHEANDVNLTEAVTLEGQVVDDDGNAVVGARVALLPISSFFARGRLPAGVVVTDEAGRFVLLDAPAEPLTLHAYQPTAGRGTREVDASSDSTSDLTVVVSGADAEGDDINVLGGGLAITLGTRDTSIVDWVVVLLVEAGSEAERAGLRPGDRLSAIDGSPPPDLNGARAQLQGRAGTDVVVEIERDGRSLSFRVRREAVSR